MPSPSVLWSRSRIFFYWSRSYLKGAALPPASLTENLTKLNLNKLFFTKLKYLACVNDLKIVIYPQ